MEKNSSPLALRVAGDLLIHLAATLGFAPVPRRVGLGIIRSFLWSGVQTTLALTKGPPALGSLRTPGMGKAVVPGLSERLSRIWLAERGTKLTPAGVQGEGLGKGPDPGPLDGMTVVRVAGLTAALRSAMLTFRRRLPAPAPAPAPEAGFPRLRAAAVADMLPTRRVAAAAELTWQLNPPSSPAAWQDPAY